MSSKNKQKSKIKKKDIKYGAVDLPDETFDAKNVKRRITMFMDMDLIDELKKRAKKEHMGYQTKINQIVRRALFGDFSLEKRLERLEEIILKEEAY